MAGWGRCRRCSGQIWWGTNPRDESRAFPFDDAEEQQSHFETCPGVERVTDDIGVRHQVAHCKGCGARVWWETTINGKRRPMDVDGDHAVDECHFDTCAGQPRGAPRPDPEPQRHATDPRVAKAPYEVRLWLPDLGLGWPVTPEEVTSAFRRLAMIHHPDMGGRSSDFIRIKLAYDRLRQLLGTVAV